MIPNKNDCDKLEKLLREARANIETARADASAWACAVIAAEEKSPDIVKFICDTHDKIIMKKL
jgi:hypothetical protein